MSLKHVSAGDQAPKECNVIIEIAASGDPIKYEVDKTHGMLQVDRFLSTAMRYPCNYGYVPHTLCGDGDPVDMLVVAPFPLMPSTVITCRPVGVLLMEDEAGEDYKILSVPINRLSAMYANVHKPEDLPEALLQKIAHFFKHYKDLEKNKWAEIRGWAGEEKAIELVADAMQAFTKVPVS